MIDENQCKFTDGEVAAAEKQILNTQRELSSI
jgi:hypothetical protein